MKNADIVTNQNDTQTTEEALDLDGCKCDPTERGERVRRGLVFRPDSGSGNHDYADARKEIACAFQFWRKLQQNETGEHFCQSDQSQRQSGTRATEPAGQRNDEQAYNG